MKPKQRHSELVLYSTKNPSASLAAQNILLCSRCVHLSDNDGIHDIHQVPGRGSFPWQQHIPAFLRTGYRGPLMLEVASKGRDRRALPAFLDDCFASAERLRLDCLAGLAREDSVLPSTSVS